MKKYSFAKNKQILALLLIVIVSLIFISCPTPYESIIELYSPENLTVSYNTDTFETHLRWKGSDSNSCYYVGYTNSNVKPKTYNDLQGYKRITANECYFSDLPDGTYYFWVIPTLKTHKSYKKINVCDIKKGVGTGYVNISRTNLPAPTLLLFYGEDELEANETIAKEKFSIKAINFPEDIENSYMKYRVDEGTWSEPSSLTENELKEFSAFGDYEIECWYEKSLSKTQIRKGNITKVNCNLVESAAPNNVQLKNVDNEVIESGAVTNKQFNLTAEVPAKYPTTGKFQYSVGETTEWNDFLSDKEAKHSFFLEADEEVEYTNLKVRYYVSDRCISDIYSFDSDFTFTVDKKRPIAPNYETNRLKGALELKWTKPSCEDITEIKVSYKTSTSNTYVENKSYKTPIPGKGTVRLETEEPLSFGIFTYDKAGNITETIIDELAPLEEPTISDLRAEIDTEANDIALTWSGDKKDGCYVVGYTTNNSEITSHSDLIGLTKVISNTHTYTDLDDGTYYFYVIPSLDYENITAEEFNNKLVSGYQTIYKAAISAPEILLYSDAIELENNTTTTLEKFSVKNLLIPENLDNCYMRYKGTNNIWSSPSSKIANTEMTFSSYGNYDIEYWFEKTLSDTQTKKGAVTTISCNLIRKTQPLNVSLKDSDGISIQSGTVTNKDVYLTAEEPEGFPDTGTFKYKCTEWNDFSSQETNTHHFSVPDGEEMNFSNLQIVYTVSPICETSRYCYGEEFNFTIDKIKPVLPTYEINSGEGIVELAWTKPSCDDLKELVIYSKTESDETYIEKTKYTDSIPDNEVLRVESDKPVGFKITVRDNAGNTNEKIIAEVSPLTEPTLSNLVVGINTDNNNIVLLWEGDKNDGCYVVGYTTNNSEITSHSDLSGLTKVTSNTYTYTDLDDGTYYFYIIPSLDYENITAEEFNNKIVSGYQTIYKEVIPTPSILLFSGETNLGKNATVSTGNFSVKTTDSFPESIDNCYMKYKVDEEAWSNPVLLTEEQTKEFTSYGNYEIECWFEKTLSDTQTKKGAVTTISCNLIRKTKPLNVSLKDSDGISIQSSAVTNKDVYLTAEVPSGFSTSGKFQYSVGEELEWNDFSSVENNSHRFTISSNNQAEYTNLKVRYYVSDSCISDVYSFGENFKFILDKIQPKIIDQTLTRLVGALKAEWTNINPEDFKEIVVRYKKYSSNTYIEKVRYTDNIPATCSIKIETEEPIIIEVSSYDKAGNYYGFSWPATNPLRVPTIGDINTYVYYEPNRIYVSWGGDKKDGNYVVGYTTSSEEITSYKDLTGTTFITKTSYTFENFTDGTYYFWIIPTFIAYNDFDNIKTEDYAAKRRSGYTIVYTPDISAPSYTIKTDETQLANDETINTEKFSVNVPDFPEIVDKCYMRYKINDGDWSEKTTITEGQETEFSTAGDYDIEYWYSKVVSSDNEKEGIKALIRCNLLDNSAPTDVTLKDSDNVVLQSNSVTNKDVSLTATVPNGFPYDGKFQYSVGESTEWNDFSSKDNDTHCFTVNDGEEVEYSNLKIRYYVSDNCISEELAIVPFTIDKKAPTIIDPEITRFEGEVQLHWTSPVCDDLQTYQIFAKKDGAEAFSLWQNYNTDVDDGIPANGTLKITLSDSMDVKIIAIDSNLNESIKILQNVTPILPPDEPTNLITSVDPMTGNIIIRWDGKANDGHYVIGYRDRLIIGPSTLEGVVSTKESQITYSGLDGHYCFYIMTTMSDEPENFTHEMACQADIIQADVTEQ